MIIGPYEAFMKISVIAVVPFLLVGCESSRQGASLTPEQAQALAIQLANQKADTLYHCQPFHDGQPARFMQGHWVWSDTRGYGHGDIQAIVELAANGSTNNVDVEFFDNGVMP
jgi:hypothetical protein